MIVLALLSLVFRLSATSYYVSNSGSNSNPGTEALPFLSIQYGIDQLTAGDHLFILSGTYAEKISIQNFSGSAAVPSYIMGVGDVIIDGSGLTPNGREGLLTLTNSSYVSVINLELRNFETNGGATPMGILVNGTCSNIHIIGNTIYNIRNNTTCSDCAEGAHGIGVFGTTAAGIQNIVLSYNEVYDNVLQSSEAFVVNGNVSDFYVISNHVHDNNNIGFDFIGYEDECSGCGEDDRARNGIVSRNIAANNSSISNPWYNSSDGTAGGFYVDGGRYILFESNTSYGNDIGFEFASEMPSQKTEDILMVNNYIYSNIEAGIKLGGYNADASEPGGGSSERIHIYNNSCYQNKGWGSEIVFDQRVIDCNIGNNIFYGAASVGENFENFGSGHSGNTWGTNVWWGTSTNGQDNLEGTLIVQNPIFISAASGDLAIGNTSPAKNEGTIYADLTTWPSSFWITSINSHRTNDYQGMPRINSTIDIGADEYYETIDYPITLTADCIGFYPGLLDEVVAIDGSLTQYSVSVLDQDEIELYSIPPNSEPLIINTLAFGDAFRYLVIQHNSIPDLGYQGVFNE